MKRKEKNFLEQRAKKLALKKDWEPCGPIFDALKQTIEDSKNFKWHWAYTFESECKYIDIRIDMRDGHCLLFNRDHEQIDLEDIRKGYEIGALDETDLDI